MSRNRDNTKNSKSKLDKRSYIIIVLILIIIVLTIFILSSTIKSNDEIKKEKLLSTSMLLQQNLSYYLGKMQSDTFSLYTNMEIISGKIESTSEEIKDTNDEKLLPIVDIEQKYEISGRTAYKLNAENVKTTFNIELPEIEGISWYVQDASTIKVKLETAPSWWTQDLDFLEVGNN